MGNVSAGSFPDSIDEFTASLFSMPLLPVATAPAKPLFSVPNLIVPSPASAKSSFSAMSSAESPRKLYISKSTCSAPIAAAREYRRTVAIPRYLDKRKRRKWTRDLMHPSRSVAAHRRPRKGGKFGAVSAKFVSSIELGSLRQ
mmetsp:Transcript_47468/g.95629  ORF Transcript_47468/g.95629 Transcript_47468/m.95629 type:complete len:143 (-) Transcript_47468:89-517(-)